MDGSKQICIVVAGLFLGVLGLAPASADVVHLTNGRSLEGVILEETADRVLLQLPFGEIGFSQSSVARIERGRSALEEYLQRRRALQYPPGGASEWLDLAYWAMHNGLEHNAREATMVAARLDPGLPGLVPLMTAMGYGYEENLAVWMPHDELMRRRGFVQSNGQWVTAQHAAELRQAAAAASARELERLRQERLARALEMMALTQIAQAQESQRLWEEIQAPQTGIPLWGGYPVIVAPGYWPHPHGGTRRSHRDHRGSRRSHGVAIVNRPPGSLIPVAPAESNRGGIQKASGTD